MPPYQRGFAGANGKNQALTFSELVHYDLKTGSREVCAGVGHYLFGETIFEQRRNSSLEPDGDVLTLAFNQKAQLAEVMVFAALDIEKRPVEKLMIPLRIPAGFHRSWVGI